VLSPPKENTNPYSFYNPPINGFINSTSFSLAYSFQASAELLKKEHVGLDLENWLMESAEVAENF
jgi:hypothetical protein